MERHQGSEGVSEVHQHALQALPQKVKTTLSKRKLARWSIMYICGLFGSRVYTIYLDQLSFRENVDQASDEHEYEKEILAEVVELEVEHEEDYQKKLLEYKKQLEEWKLWRKKKVRMRHVSVCRRAF